MSDLDRVDIVVRTYSQRERIVRTWNDYPVETRAAVAALSRGSCYFPGCRTPIVVFLSGRLAVNVDVFPIHSSPSGGPTYHFDNLLFLCVPHRNAVDRDEAAHPIDLLRNWKAHREAGHQGALTALGEVTADRLDDLLVTAFSAAQEQIAEALTRFEKVDPESAHLVRSLMHDLGVQRRSATGSADELHDRYDEVIARLQAAAGRLDDLATRVESTAGRANIGWTTGS